LLGLVATNLTRRYGRTIATAVGIALGVATIVALLSTGSGLKRTAAELIHLGQADLGVFQKGVADPTASILPESLATRLERRPDVARATPLLLLIEAVRRDPAAVVFGADPKGFFARRLVVTSGVDRLGREDVMVGERLASRLGLRPGGTLRLGRRRFTVAGVYHTGVFFVDSGAVINLRRAQRMLHRSGDATTIAVEIAPDVRDADAERAIRRAMPDIQIIGTPDDAVRAGANGRLIRNAVRIIGALALIVGGLGVANTMAMAVLERQRELALLSAVGWQPLRIATLVLAEGVFTSMLGAALVLLLGVVGVGWLGDALGVSSVVSPDVTPWTIGQALLIGVAIGVLGGLYPAWRATRSQGSSCSRGRSAAGRSPSTSRPSSRWSTVSARSATAAS
jgi:putative ABC transport system permease protein